MKTYTITFTGRKLGAIGIVQTYQVTIRAPSEQDAITKLYEEYEHITSFHATVKE
jgi:hypothetical protein